MKTVKQILGESQTIDYTDRLSVLSSLGLLEESKMGLVRRSLEKNPMNMTMAESKALKEFVDNILSQMLLEKQDYLSKFDKRVPKGYPSDRDMPTVLILKRKAIRVYPDNQKVALYYSQALDRYISIPFNGARGEPLGMVMNEEYTHDSPEYTDKEREILRKLAKKYSKQPNAIIDYPHDTPTPTPKKLKEESVSDRFRSNVQMIREERLDEGWEENTLKVLKGLDVAGDVATVAGLGATVASGGFAAPVGLGGAALGLGAKAVSKLGTKVAGKWLRNRIAKKAAEKGTTKAVDRQQKVLDRLNARRAKQGKKPVTKKDIKRRNRLRTAADIAALGAGALGGALSGKDGDPIGKKLTPAEFRGINLNVEDPRGKRATLDMGPTAEQLRRFGNVPGGYSSGTAGWQQESNLSIIRKLSRSKSLLEQKINFLDENDLTINKGTAKKIMKVYNSLNESNKGKMEKMLNESVVTFTQAINFAVRQ